MTKLAEVLDGLIQEVKQKHERNHGAYQEIDRLKLEIGRLEEEIDTNEFDILELNKALDAIRKAM